jgi:DNA helicase HerA-like ATPase
MWLNGLGDQQNKASFVAMVLADVYAWMLRQRGGAPRVLLYFDEIGPYMPPHGEPPSKKLLKRIFKEGRKYGVCGLFCTQNFTDVDYKVVSQASTIAIGRLNAAQEKKKAADALGAPPNFDVNAAVDRLVGSPVGRFVVKRVEGSPHWLQGRRLVTEHAGTWGEDEIRAHTSDAARAAWNETPAKS